jgi:hypothetical protein
VKAGAELVRNRGASGDGALIDQYLETGHRQIGGANKTVVATTDNDHIVHHPPFHNPITARIISQKAEFGQKRGVRREASAFGPAAPQEVVKVSLGLAFAGSSSISVRLIYSTHFLKAPRLE